MTLDRTNLLLTKSISALKHVALCSALITAAWAAQPEHCSLAVISDHIAEPAQKVCDRATVLSLAKGGSVYEQNQLGMASMLILGPDYKPKDALDWFDRAAHKGYAPAQVNLAVMYMNGWGTAKNYGAAIHWLQEAAQQKFGRAYYNLGLLYMKGEGVHQDYSEAARLFRLGADAGDDAAETNLAYLYDRGLGVGRDAKTAAALYRRAADKGNPMAQNNLADMYLHGEGVQKDESEAFRLFQRAAEQGHTGASIELAYMYALGRGTAKNLEVAYSWVSAATAAGDNRGRDLLNSLQAQMKSDQLVRARAAARLKPATMAKANSFQP